MPVEMICESCKQPFYCYPSEAEDGRKYCSRTCRGAHLHKKGTSALHRTPVHFTCKECSKDFVMMQAYLTAYTKKFGRGPLYCSMACSGAGRRRDNEARNKFTCVNCGKDGFRRRNQCGRVYVEQKLCSKQCKNEWVSKLYRERNGLPEITKRVKRGYVELRIPARDGVPVRHVLEHRRIMEGILGRPLTTKETVHHKNGVKTDNRPENLELFGSNHGRGQRVTDMVADAIKILQTYAPEAAAERGVALVPVEKHEDDPLPP